MRKSIAPVMRLLILPLMVGALCAADQTAGKSGGSPITATGTHPSAYPLLIGDTIPTTLPMTMLQGDPIKEFKPGEVYVLECWSDFSNLLSEARIPHLDALHRKMGPKGVVIIGVNVSPGDRSKEQTLAKAEEEVRNYIKHQGKKMSYRVALDGNKFISDWLERSEAQGLLSDNDGTLHTTHTFIVKGRAAFAAQDMGVFQNVDVFGKHLFAHRVHQETGFAVQRSATDCLHKAA